MTHTLRCRWLLARKIAIYWGKSQSQYNHSQRANNWMFVFQLICQAKRYCSSARMDSGANGLWSSSRGKNSTHRVEIDRIQIQRWHRCSEDRWNMRPFGGSIGRSARHHRRWVDQRREPITKNAIIHRGVNRRHLHELSGRLGAFHQQRIYLAAAIDGRSIQLAFRIPNQCSTTEAIDLVCRRYRTNAHHTSRRTIFTEQ